MNSDQEDMKIVYTSQSTILERPSWRNEEFTVDFDNSTTTTEYHIQIFSRKKQRKFKTS